jgi:AcrR family transcriptional regulator
LDQEQAHAKRGRGRPQTLDRAHTVEVAMNSYWRDGVREVSLNEVCRRANVSKPGVYREFGNEDGLTAAAVALYQETVLAPLAEVLEAELPFAEVLDRLLSWLTEPSGKPVGCLMAELRAAPGALGPLTAAKVSAVHEQTRQAYERWVRRAAARGEVSLSVSPALAASFIAAQLAAVALEMRIGGDPATVRGQAELAFRALAPPAATA